MGNTDSVRVEIERIFRDNEITVSADVITEIIIEVRSYGEDEYERGRRDGEFYESYRNST